MPKIMHVKKAREDRPERGIKKGQEYWWCWIITGPRSSHKRFFTSPPRRSQLTVSKFWQPVYAIQEEMEDADPKSAQELTEMVEDWKGRIEEIRDECQGSYDNMPSHLQDTGRMGPMIQERIEAMENWFNELDNLDLEFDEDSNEDETEFIDNKLDEIRSFSVDCD